jgi:hypothetical protein
VNGLGEKCICAQRRWKQLEGVEDRFIWVVFPLNVIPSHLEVVFWPLPVCMRNLVATLDDQGISFNRGYWIELLLSVQQILSLCHFILSSFVWLSNEIIAILFHLSQKKGFLCETCWKTCHLFCLFVSSLPYLTVLKGQAD